MIRKQKNKCSAFDLYMEMMWLLIGLQLVVNLFRFMNSLILPWLKMHKVFFTTRESLSWGPELFIMIAGFVKVACNICGVAAAIHLWEQFSVWEMGLIGSTLQIQHMSLLKGSKQRKCCKPVGFGVIMVHCDNLKRHWNTIWFNLVKLVPIGEGLSRKR